jgi:hypothetical protein
MKPVKNVVFAALLLFALAFNTFAGDIETPGFVPPPPPRMSVSYENTTAVTDANTEQTIIETSDYLLIEALAALLSVY